MTEAAIELCGVSNPTAKSTCSPAWISRCRRARCWGSWAPTASGKTTLIKCALGLIRPQSGKTRLLGEPSWTLSGEAKARIGYVPQVISLYPWMKVRHLIDYTSAFYPNWNHDLVDRLIDEWDIPARRSRRPALGGPTPKVAILLAVGHEPDLLILDEPAASLDPLARRQFLQMIIDLAEPGNAPCCSPRTSRPTWNTWPIAWPS